MRFSLSRPRPSATSNAVPAPPEAPGARGGSALERVVLYLTWLVPVPVPVLVLEQFPRSQRFLLGDRLQGLALDLLDLRVEAQYRKAPRAESLRVFRSCPLITPKDAWPASTILAAH